FVYLNANKKSVTLNLTTITGRDLFCELVRWADLVVTSAAPKVQERLGLSPEALAKANSKIGVVSITNFGLTGPYRDWRADHMTLTALAAWAQYLGQKERPPVQPGVELALQVAGLQAASASLAIYRLCQDTRSSHAADLSIMEVIAHMLPGSPLRFAFNGMIETRGMYPFPSQGILKCKDGYVGVNTLTEEHWELLCRWMEMEDVLEDPRFKVSSGRWKHTAELRARAEKFFGQKTKRELFAEGQSWRVATGLVSNPEDIYTSEHLRDRRYFAATQHPAFLDVEQPGAPIRMIGSPWSLRSPAPELGQHNLQVFCGMMGFSQPDLVMLREQGAI
ncbi:MAG: CoA transferase, partial [Chloroflexi bacterium]|nr:CoA transferase [Chloroflexota bacterium]